MQKTLLQVPNGKIIWKHMGFCIFDYATPHPHNLPLPLPHCGLRLKHRLPLGGVERQIPA